MATIEHPIPAVAQRVQAIVSKTAEVMMVPAAFITLPTRGSRTIARARQVAMYVALRLTQASAVELAAAFRRDRTCLSVAKINIEQLIQRDGMVRHWVERIEAELLPVKNHTV